MSDSRLQVSAWRARTLVAVFACIALALAYSSGPPNGTSGRPGENTCLACHSGSPGSSDSSHLLGFAPVGYQPDSLYSLTLSVSYAGQRRWGFQLTAVNSANEPMGNLVVLDPVNTQLGSGPGRYEYLKQTSAGTFPGTPGPTSWQVGWRAPAGGAGPVCFYWCCAAANNNNSSSGDTIIRDSLVVFEAAAVVSEPAQGRVFWRYANPARHRVAISYRGDPSLPVRIYSSAGKLVRLLRPQPEGDLLRVIWDGRDEQGRVAPASSYFVRVGQEVESVMRVQVTR